MNFYWMQIFIFFGRKIIIYSSLEKDYNILQFGRKIIIYSSLEKREKEKKALKHGYKE